MFVETSFDDDFGESQPSPVVPPSVMENQSAATHTIHLHKPGDVGFCSVAGSNKGGSNFFDDRTVNGDSWVSDECRCTRCECIRVMSAIENLRASMSDKQPIVLVLVDLDNFGFNQFKSVPPSMEADLTDVNVLEHMYVWSFFGSCFTRYHKRWPSAEAVCETLPQKNLSIKPKPSIWQRLVKDGRVHFTPCGGQSQGADEVMLDVVKAFQYMDVILVTSDVQLLQKIYQHRRLVGMKTRRDNEADMMAERLTLVNVQELGKRFVPVWREMAFRVTQCVRNARGGDTETPSDD